MGYQVYNIGERWGGYGVPTLCEYPTCSEKIDRGVAFACGGEPFSEYGCDRYFCEKHKEYHEFNTGGGYRVGVEVCERCAKRKSPFPYKPERPEWIRHLLTDKSWKDWRISNPHEVKRLNEL